VHVPTLRLALVGPYPPTPCGIATFTESLLSAVVKAGVYRGWSICGEVFRLTNDDCEPASPAVATDWIRGDQSSMYAALERAGEYDAVIVQHEFGIFGGADGCEVVEFVRQCPVEVVVVLHTVVPKPTDHQRSIIESLLQDAATVIVQSHAARSRLAETYVAGSARVEVIPHGAVANFDGPRVDLALDDAPVLLTWGLLGPGKGIEHVIRALATLGEDVPVPTYLVAGCTHPNVARLEGERYRDGLRALAVELGVADRVVFDGDYRSCNELRTLIRSCDIVVLPYDNRDQVTSGVLVEALASARPIIATAFPHAVEALASGSGAVIPHENVPALATAIEQMLIEPRKRVAASIRARSEAQSLLWPSVGQRYLDVLPEVAAIRGVA